MTKPRVTTADRLSNIFEVVELGRRSGLLTVERGSPQALEQGEVYFSQGRAIYAMVEGLQGRDALTALGSWGQCRFAFEPNAPLRAPNIPEPQPMRPPEMDGANGANGANGMRGSGGYPPPQRAQPTPTRGAPATFDWNAPSNRPLPDPLTPGSSSGAPTGPQVGGGAPSTPSTPSYGASWPTGWPSNTPSRANTSGQLNWPAPHTGALPSFPSGASTPSQSTGPFTGPFAGGAPLNAEALERRPRRSLDVRDLIAAVSAHNLSRNHRTILLLADGEHTVHDLARLSSKSVDEILALLADLERLGLVYYY